MKTKSTCQSTAHQHWDCPTRYFESKRFTKDRWCPACREEFTGRFLVAEPRRKKVAA